MEHSPIKVKANASQDGKRRKQQRVKKKHQGYACNSQRHTKQPGGVEGETKQGSNNKDYSE